MNNITPLFPLNLVVFPGEKLNLHIFEPRYKQLINDCLSESMNFGIPSYVKKKIEIGTEMRILSVEKLYDDGRMDIKTVGVRVFEVINYINPAPGKLYAEGELRFCNTDFEGDETLSEELINLINKLYEIIKINKVFTLDEVENAYQLAHRIGLSQEQEYELLKLEKEVERQNFVINHLNKSIPTLREMEKTREMIKMNGHFKHFDPINF